MKRLIVCCDGTWNNPDQEENGIPCATNVYKIHNAIRSETENGVTQLTYYHPGVGGEPGIKNKLLGGAFGVGISRHICSAYHWLGRHYQEGDEIFLFGFSRGAFTARSLGGFLSKGLLDIRELWEIDPAESWTRVKRAYEKGYRKKDSNTEDWAESDWVIFHDRDACPIRFVGVWDTVGALGVPDDLEIVNFFDKQNKWKFHDNKIGSHIKSGRHAMSIDELRSCFTVTRWENASTHPDTLEVWFPGVHSDVGGGYADTDLSDGALEWMMQEASSAGLSFREAAVDMIVPRPLGIMHNSYKGVFAKLRSRPRNIDAIIRENTKLFHESVFERQSRSPISHPPYHPTKILSVGESSGPIDIYAGKHWNPTGLFFPKDHTFIFSAVGEWLDSKDACSWEGTERDDWTTGDLMREVGTFLGKFEKIFKNLTKNESTDFLLTKRVEYLPWFTLVGAIANDNGSKKEVTSDGTPVLHECVALADYQKPSHPLHVTHSGYLYCFANDVWSLYKNNHGAVTLNVTRIS